jgi:hypothetical protein
LDCRSTLLINLQSNLQSDISNLKSPDC